MTTDADNIDIHRKIVRCEECDSVITENKCPYCDHINNYSQGDFITTEVEEAEVDDVKKDMPSVTNTASTDRHQKAQSEEKYEY